MKDVHALLEVLPKQARVAQMKFVPGVSEYFGETRVVEHQASVLVDHRQRRRAEIEQLTQLAFMLGLGSERGIVFSSCGLFGASRHGLCPVSLTTLASCSWRDQRRAFHRSAPRSTRQNVRLRKGPELAYSTVERKFSERGWDNKNYWEA